MATGRHCPAAVSAVAMSTEQPEWASPLGSIECEVNGYWSKMALPPPRWARPPPRAHREASSVVVVVALLLVPLLAGGIS